MSTGNENRHPDTINADQNETSASKPVPQNRSPAEVQDWIVTYLARHLSIQPNEIDVSVPFEQFAIDSPSAIEMTGHLEDWLGRRVDPMMVYDYPTIKDMAGYLGGDDASE